MFGRKKSPGEPSGDWEQPVFVRDEVDFADEEQRTRYVAGCLEQMTEAEREIDLLTGEYGLVTSYLTDIEEIEALPPEEKEKLENIARRLAALEREKQQYAGKKDRMGNSEFYRIRKMEKEMEEGISKMQSAEEYGSRIRQDLQRLDGERQAYSYRRSELETLQGNLRGMAVIFLTALVLCLLMLAVLQFGFEMNAQAGYVLAIAAASVAIIVLSVKYTNADRELTRVEKASNRLIQLQNKVKIRYVNNKNLLNYLYMKYDAESSEKLRKLWMDYQQEKEERKQYAEAEAKTEYYQKQLVGQMAHYRVRDPDRWINQSAALLDKREMVEIRHALILRRQALREQLDYNQKIGENARQEVKDLVGRYPAYAAEILDMVEHYGG